MKAQSNIKIGATVRYRAKGKTARLEGMAGKIATGRVLSSDSERVVVMPDHRCTKDAVFHNLKAAIAISDLI